MHGSVHPFITILLLVGWTSSAIAGRPGPEDPTAAEKRWAAWELRQALDDQSPFRALPWRCVGPVVQGGRLVDIAVHPDDPYTFYAAYASGGLWKTTNNGLSFEPLFDDQPTMIMGDIALDPQDPQTVWVGTGENNSSRSSYSGLGVFRSRDGGETSSTWASTMPTASGASSSIRANSDRVLVAVLGALYTGHSERGLYLTTDGGTTWRRVLEGKKHDRVHRPRAGSGEPGSALCLELGTQSAAPGTSSRAARARASGAAMTAAIPGNGSMAGSPAASTSGASGWPRRRPRHARSTPSWTTRRRSRTTSTRTAARSPRASCAG